MLINKKNIKKNILILVYYIFLSHFCIAQVNDAGKRVDPNKLEAIKVAYMTKELNLTSSEAKSFWSLYNHYKVEIKEARKSHLQNEINYEETVVGIKKKYKGEFLQVLGSESRVNLVFVSEKHFRDMLRTELKKRRLNNSVN